MVQIEKDCQDIKDGFKTKQDIKIVCLDFPFNTFLDQDYASFITGIFNILEIRLIKKGTIIADQLEECNEILFVERGKYMMGFQINN